MNPFILFGILTVPLLMISWKSLLKPGSHGFYRFLAWEGILWLLICNYRFWFDNVFCFRQLASWLFLFVSLYLVLAGAIVLKLKGKSSGEREGSNLLAFEKTTRLVVSGIYSYIRHPLYSSLFFLTWGVYLKHPPDGTGIAVLTSLFLFITAEMDERESTAYFGEAYQEYRKHTKRFIPFVF